MPADFLALAQIITAIEASAAAARRQLDSRPDGGQFVLGELSVALSAEMRTDGEQVFARLPALVDGEPRVPPEYLSRISFTLRPSISLER